MGFCHPNRRPSGTGAGECQNMETWRRVLLTKPVPTGKEPWSCQEYLLGLPGTVALQLLSLTVLMQIVALKSPPLICLPL